MSDRPYTEEDVESLAGVLHEMDGLLGALIFEDCEALARQALDHLAERLLPKERAA